MAADALRAISLHRQHGGLDHCGNRTAAVADLWPDAHAGGRVAACFGGQRPFPPDRLHGHVRGVGHSIPAARLSGDRARTGGGIMETLWFMLVAVMIAVYVVLD